MDFPVLEVCLGIQLGCSDLKGLPFLVYAQVFSGRHV